LRIRYSTFIHLLVGLYNFVMLFVIAAWDGVFTIIFWVAAILVMIIILGYGQEPEIRYLYSPGTTIFYKLDH
jgi:hypothetical protein